MATTPRSVRMAPGRWEAVQAKMRQEHLYSVSDVINTLVEDWLQDRITLTEVRGLNAGGPAPEPRQAVSYPGPVAGRLDRLAALLRDATPDSPVSKKDLADGTGYSPETTGGYLTWLTRAGTVTRVGYNAYAATPGTDMGQAVRDAAAGVAAIRRDERSHRRAGQERGGEEQQEPARKPEPPRRRAAQRAIRDEAEAGSPRRPRRTGPRPGPAPAAAARPDKTAAVRQVRDKAEAIGAPLVAASELAAAVTQVHTKACRHPLNVRLGDTCGICHQTIRGNGRKR